MEVAAEAALFFGEGFVGYKALAPLENLLATCTVESGGGGVVPRVGNEDDFQGFITAR